MAGRCAPRTEVAGALHRDVERDGAVSPVTLARWYDLYVNKRIVVNPDVCSGKPVIRGTRIMVRNVLGIVAGGGTLANVLESYPELTPEDVSAALEYAADVVDRAAALTT